MEKEGLLAISTPISGLAVLTGEKRTIPIWKICNDNMTVKPAEKDTFQSNVEVFSSVENLLTHTTIWTPLCSGKTYLVVEDRTWKCCWKASVGQIDWQSLTLMLWPTWALCLLFSEGIKRKRGFSRRKTHPERASLPSPGAGWSQGRPWRRWEDKARWGWRSSRGFSAGFSRRRWCQGRARGSSRRSPRSSWPALLKNNTCTDC